MIDVIRSMDLRFLMWIDSVDFSTLWDYFFYFITTLGNKGFIWIAISMILIAIPKYRKTGITLFFSLILITLVGEFGLKPLIGRSRPFQVHSYFELNMVHASGYSLPSGHTSSSFAAAIVLANRFKNQRLLIWSSAVLMGFSRMYFFVHYPSDILLGALLGVASGIIANQLVKINMQGQWIT
jgi:undecaprenyl-diphosphatase